MSKMENDNSIEYKESDDDERVEIDPRDVRKMNEPICVIQLPNGNYKQPTKKEIKVLEEKGMSNPCLGNVSLKTPTALPPTNQAETGEAKANEIPKRAKRGQQQSHSDGVAHSLGAAALAPVPSQCRALGTECHQFPAEA